MLAKIMVAFLAVVAVFAFIGFLQEVWEKKRGIVSAEEKGDLLPEKALDNILNVRDCFNRARYMDRDGN